MMLFIYSHKMPYNEMSKKKPSDTISMHESLVAVHQKVDKKPSISRTYTLMPHKANT